MEIDVDHTHDEEIVIEDEDDNVYLDGDKEEIEGGERDGERDVERGKEEESDDEDEGRERGWRREDDAHHAHHLFPPHGTSDDVPLMQEDEEEGEEDNEIILEIRRKGLPKRKESLQNLISENRKALGITPAPLSVAVHELSLSVHVTLAKTQERNILQDVRERLRIDERRSVKKLLLRNVSFYVKENMMLLILGPPGCGKTSLLRVMSHTVYGHQTGDIYFNRKPIDPDLHHRMTSFVGQEDEHLPALTVRQTLQFAGDLQLSTEFRPAHTDVSSHVDIVLQILGLTHRADTIVGNAMMRGVSGGEKKRVTIGVELMKNPRLLLLDEATTGLDTATSVELGKFCRTIADNYIPVVAALLQPPLKLYRKFDHILLLCDGEVTYFGPRSRVLPYFESIGFRCPKSMNPADYLVSLMTHMEEYRIPGHPLIVEHQRDFADVYLESALFNDEIIPQIYGEFPPEKIPADFGLKTVRVESDDSGEEQKTMRVESDDDGDAGSHDREVFDLKPRLNVTESGDGGSEGVEMMDMAEAGSILKMEKRESGGGLRDSRGSKERREREKERERAMEQEVVKGVTTAEEERLRSEFEKKVFGLKYPRSMAYQVYALVKRGWQQQVNFPAFFIIMSVYSLFLAVFYGTLFFQLGYTQSDVPLRYGIVFNIVLVMGFKASASNDAVFRERKVFEMQRTKRYYSTLPYCIAGLINYIPMLAIDISLFATVAYWLIGLSAAEDGARFLFLILVGVLLTLACDGWIRMVAQINDDFTTAQGIGPFSMGSLMLFTGFFRPIQQMPWAVRWLAYVSPFRWAYEALVINEMANQEFTCTESQMVPPTSYYLFNDTYSAGGFEGYQTCPITNGNEILVMFNFPTDQNWKWFCVLFLFIIVFAFQFGVFMLFKFVSHQNPPTRRLTRPPADAEVEIREPKNAKNEEEVSMIEMDDLQTQRDSKPRVTVEFTDVSYSVKGAKSAEDAEDEEKAEAVRLAQSLANVTEGGEGEEKYPGGLATLRMCLRAREERSYITLINRISGRVEPGMMLALMGPSGAGKSTLMDVIAGRKTGGKITGRFFCGEILFNRRKRDDNFSRYTGYCEQQDLHMEYATVYEAVRLAALTRLPASWPRDTKIANVIEIIERLRLSSVTHTLVKDLRAEQRKRLTVAVELVCNPSVLFLDEPTSGLDTTEAAEIMRVVKEETRRGMSVCCTIHQPSSQIFSLFTHILLLKKGGEMVYFGKTSEMLGYFERRLGRKCPEHENPADFALEVLKPISHSDPDPARVWLESAEHHDAMEREDDSEESDVSIKEKRLSRAWTAEYESKYPASFFSQCAQLVTRSIKNIYRRPQDFRVRFWRNLILGVVSGGVFFQLGNDQSSAGSRLASFFFLMIVATFNAFTQITMISLDRPAYYRERLAGSYRALAYLVGIVIPDLPFVLMNFLLYAIPQYFMSGLRLSAEAIGYYFLIGFGSSILSFALIQFLAIISFNPGLASLLGGVTITISNMLAGFFIPKSQIPAWWIWGYYTSFVRYPLEGMAVNELANLPLYCVNNVGAIPVRVANYSQPQYYCPLTNGNQLLAKYDMSSSHMWPYLGVTFGIYFFFLLGSWYGLAKVIHLNR